MIDKRVFHPNSSILDATLHFRTYPTVAWATLLAFGRAAAGIRCTRVAEFLGSTSVPVWGGGGQHTYSVCAHTWYRERLNGEVKKGTAQLNGNAGEESSERSHESCSGRCLFYCSVWQDVRPFARMSLAPVLHRSRGPIGCSPLSLGS